jgi:acyl-CoA reductase-like NAD-dependent aldehyde dehydrogenase
VNVDIPLLITLWTYQSKGLISDAAAPFGGIKQSGFGREGSSLGIEEYMAVKSFTFGGMGLPLMRS